LESVKKLEAVKLHSEVALALERLRTRLGLSWNALAILLLDEYCSDHPDESACIEYARVRDAVQSRIRQEARPTRFSTGEKISIRLYSELIKVLRILKAKHKLTYDTLFLKLLQHYCSKHPDHCS